MLSSPRSESTKCGLVGGSCGMKMSPELVSRGMMFTGIVRQTTRSFEQCFTSFYSTRRPSRIQILRPAPLVVPFRSLTTHKPLVGITVSGIGPMTYKGSGLVDHVYFHSKKVCIDLENTLMHNAQSRQLASTSHQSRQTVIRHHITNAVMYLPHTTMYHKPRARRRGHTGIQDSEEVRDPPRTGASRSG